MLKLSKLVVKPLPLPIFKNLFFLSLYISSGVIILKSSKFLLIDILRFFSIKFLSLCAPPSGSGIISSIISRFNRSFAESFIALAASNIFFGSLHKIVAHPSGEITE